MALNDVFPQNLKPPDKPTKRRDGGGLYLCASPTGLKSWRFNYRFQGKYLTMTFGQYPLVSLN
ncbi:MAG: Arm DNA-binding domain-containing protein [Deltaproteobacteria bacterium]|nr:Arm DNA-binding domain-containing protein [Deltaproteobacteria bacterium]